MRRALAVMVLRVRAEACAVLCMLSFWCGHHLHANVASLAAPSAHYALSPPRTAAPPANCSAACPAREPCPETPPKAEKCARAPPCPAWCRNAKRVPSAAGLLATADAKTPAWKDAWAADARATFAELLPGFSSVKMKENAAAVLFAHNALPKEDNRTFATVKAALAARGCNDVAVLLATSRRAYCLAVVESDMAPAYFLARVKLDASTPYVSKYHGSVAGAPRGPRATAAPGFPSVEKLLTNLLVNADAVVAELEPVLNERVAVGQTDRTVVVLAVNRGVLDLVANFLCSARHNIKGGDALVKDRAVVFAADADAARALEPSVAAVYSHDALGAFPSKAAGRYGDSTFVAMMWLKMVSVFLVNRCGRDALFMDADVVWQANPLPILATYGEDTLWMDDVARSTRYVPFSANTGFYLIRANEMTAHFLYKVMLSFDLVVHWRSHQHVVNAVLQEHFSSLNLGVRVLPREEFQIGAIFHRNKTYADELARGIARPSVFHWAWTAGRKDKLRFARETNTWHLREECGADFVADAADPAALLDECCARPAFSPLRDFSLTPAPRPR